MKKMLTLLMGVIAVSSYDALGMNEEDRFGNGNDRRWTREELRQLTEDQLRQENLRLKRENAQLQQAQQDLKERLWQQFLDEHPELWEQKKDRSGQN